MFADLGAAVIDADRLAHETLGEPEVIERIKQKFGTVVLNAKGRIDRQKLGEFAFDSKQNIEFLNHLIHPKVIERTESLIDFYLNDASSRVLILDVPLLVEIGWEKRCDYLIFVACSFEKRLERLDKKRKINEIQLKKRENFQISLDKKARIAHYTVNNNSDESEVAEQVAQIFSSITGSK